MIYFLDDLKYIANNALSRNKFCYYYNLAIVTGN